MEDSEPFCSFNLSHGSYQLCSYPFFLFDYYIYDQGSLFSSMPRGAPLPLTLLSLFNATSGVVKKILVLQSFLLTYSEYIFNDFYHYIFSFVKSGEVFPRIGIYVTVNFSLLERSY